MSYDADPRVDAYFVLQGNICALLAARDHRAGGWRKLKREAG